MKFDCLNHKVWKYIFPFLFFSILAFICSWIFGAPLLTPDSRVYLLNSVHPWDSRHAWHPPGFSFLLFVLNGLHIPLIVQTSVIAGALSSTLFTFFRQVWNRSFSLFFTLAIWPSWLIIQMSLWSESFFLFLCLALVLLQFSRIQNSFKIILTISLWILLYQTRSAGIFFTLGILIAIYGNSPFQQSMKKILYSLGLFFTVMGLSFALTYPKQQNQMPCQQGIISLAELPLCQTSAMKDICALDSKNMLSTENINDNTLSLLHFSPESPMTKFKESNPNAPLCQIYVETLKSSLTQHPFLFSKLLLGRFLRHLGPASYSEQGPPSEINSLLNSDDLDKIFRFSRYILPSLALLSFLLFLFLAVKHQIFPMISASFLFAGLGHDLGLVINNPFLTLRYLSVTHVLILWGCLYGIGKILSERK